MHFVVVFGIIFKTGDVRELFSILKSSINGGFRTWQSETKMIGDGDRGRFILRANCKGQGKKKSYRNRKVLDFIITVSAVITIEFSAPQASSTFYYFGEPISPSESYSITHTITIALVLVYARPPSMDKSPPVDSWDNKM